MEILQAIILGIIEGFTEFLPISSTGHLLVSEHLMGYKDTAEIFAVVIQMGAIAAVLWFYRRELIGKVVGLARKDKQAINFWLCWIIATIPAGLAALIFKDQISKYAVASTVGVSLIVGGLIIWLIESYHRAPKNTSENPRFEKLTISQALQVGLYQMFALVPGVSRSGSTIMGGLLAGLDRVTATAFSFYLSIPIIILAGTYQLISGWDELDTVSGGGPALAVGTISAFITALIAIKWLLKYVSGHDFKIFAYYRIIVGIIVLVALWA